MHRLNWISPVFTSALHRFLICRLSHSNTNLYVGGLSYDTNEPVLKDAFKEYGQVIQVRVICDRNSGKSRGYGFVHYSSEEEASKAMKEMDAQLLEGRKIYVRPARRREKESNKNPKSRTGTEIKKIEE